MPVEIPNFDDLTAVSLGKDALVVRCATDDRTHAPVDVAESADTLTAVLGESSMVIPETPKGDRPIAPDHHKGEAHRLLAMARALHIPVASMEIAGRLYYIFKTNAVM